MKCLQKLQLILYYYILHFIEVADCRIGIESSEKYTKIFYDSTEI